MLDSLEAAHRPAELFALLDVVDAEDERLSGHADQRGRSEGSPLVDGPCVGGNGRGALGQGLGVG